MYLVLPYLTVRSVLRWERLEVQKQKFQASVNHAPDSYNESIFARYVQEIRFGLQLVQSLLLEEQFPAENATLRAAAT